MPKNFPNLTKYKDKLLFVPLGGANEIGMNLNLYQLDGKWIIVDFGIGFSDDYMPGVDLIVPDIEFLEHIKKDILGMIITHAHEDHVGAVPYLWDRVGCPIYTTKFTAGIIREKLKDADFKKQPKLNVLTSDETFKLGSFEIEPFHLAHSIPEMHAFAIKTRYGNVFHTGDWKFDPNPLISDAADTDALKKYGKEGVLALVCDSTNVFSPGTSGSEATVRENLFKLISKAKNRVVVTTFASNLARLETIIKAAQQAGRKIVVCGRSIWRIIEVAKATGYLKNCPELFTDREFSKIPKEKALLLCTGCQGEGRAAMSRIAEQTHPAVKLNKGDLAIFSSKMIPGNEEKILRMLNLLALQDIDTITEKNEDIHTSGHPYRDELAAMYSFLKPAVAIPVHGEHAHIKEHCNFALEQGVSHAVRVQNGAVVELNKDAPKIVNYIETNYVGIDGYNFVEPKSQVMRIRRFMRDNGAVFVSLLLNKKGILQQPPIITAPGLLDNELDDDLIAKMVEYLEDQSYEGLSPQQINKRLAKKLKKFCRTITRKEPYVEINAFKI